MKKIIIFGGTGFIGLHLAAHLQSKGLEPILVSRNKPKDITDCTFVPWDAENIGDWSLHLEGAHAIVNLAGRSVDCIKTPDHCDEILRSRVDTTLLIGRALKKIKNQPQTWIQMSTAHIYGDSLSKKCDETSSLGYGLAPFVGKAWEKALLDVLPNGMREVRLRTSFVLGNDGGALTQLRQITKLGLGGTVGDGRQGMSWLHIGDMVEIIYQSIIDDKYKGIYIASAPHPLSNKNFMATLRNVMNKWLGLPAMKWMVNIGAPLFYKTDPELILYGRYVYPRRLINEGYNFKFPTLKGALDHLKSTQ